MTVSEEAGAGCRCQSITGAMGGEAGEREGQESDGGSFGG